MTHATPDDQAWPAGVVRICEKLDLIESPWTPHVVGALNGQLIKMAKIAGEFVWHAHDNEDEMFLVVEGEMMIHLREQGAATEAVERIVRLRPGEFFIVPRGVEHCPSAESECAVLLFEPASTAHAGAAMTDRAVEPDHQPRI